jgi:hypothetical protein
VAFGGVRLGLGDGEAVEPLLVGLAEADRDARHAGRDHQQVGAHLDREQGGGAVLVDHRLDAAQLAPRVLSTAMPPPPQAMMSVPSRASAR